MKTRLTLLTVILSFLFTAQQIYSQDETDPYLWLEEVDGEDAINWAKEHNIATLAVLKDHPAFQELYDKNLEVYNSDERIAYPTIRGNYIYNFWQDDNNERGLWRRTTIEEYKKESPAWEVLLDIDLLSEEESEKWVYKGASGLYPDYNLYMVELSRGGGDAFVMREFDVNTKHFVKDGFYLPEAKGSVSWKDENTLIVSTDFGEGTTTESGYPRFSKLWKRGTELSKAETLFEGNVTDVGVWDYVVNTPERDYVGVSQEVTFYTSNNYVIEKGELIKLDIPEDADLNTFFKNRMIVELKSDGVIGVNLFKQGSVISIDYNKFLNGDRNFDVIVVPDERSSIQSVSNAKNFLLVNKLTNVRSKLYKYYLVEEKWHNEKVDAPDYGSISITTADDNSDSYFFTYNSFLIPTSLYFVSADNGEITKVKSLPEFFDRSKFEVEQFEAASTDGTLIPYFIVHAKVIELDGTNPTLLYGYGGFEISMRPRYSATIGYAWLERGGVYVIANIRGGGEFGPKWHQAALKENRQIAYDDFISVAEDLINRNITSPEHLGIMGGSNGGLLVGAVFTQRPELFSAVVCRVPLLDMQRYNKLLAGASWMGEYGDPDIPEEWEFIKKYSPYHNLKEDTNYPKVFFTTSTRDDRVPPGHARKMVAKMEGMGYEVFYYENIEGGHAAATTNQQYAFINALIFSYLILQLQ
ncbi:MAG: prolyl oligopeptidase family serine peptidase [Ignavibacteriaceae bacterium]